MALVIRAASTLDAAQVADIYNPFVLTTTITFEEEPVSAEEIARRISEVQANALPWLVAVRGEEIVGFAYARAWRPRAAYRFANEVTVYVRDGLAGSGIGSGLYAELFRALKSSGTHVAIGGVALPNDASLRLHQKFGFEQVAHFKEVGFKLGRWIDVTYWQLIL